MAFPELPWKDPRDSLPGIITPFRFPEQLSALKKNAWLIQKTAGNTWLDNSTSIAQFTIGWALKISYFLKNKLLEYILDTFSNPPIILQVAKFATQKLNLSWDISLSSVKYEPIKGSLMNQKSASIWLIHLYPQESWNPTVLIFNWWAKMLVTLTFFQRILNSNKSSFGIIQRLLHTVGRYIYLTFNSFFSFFSISSEMQIDFEKVINSPTFFKSEAPSTIISEYSHG